MGASDSEFVLRGLLTYFIFLFSTVLHEASHSLSAQLMGDDTAADEGLVTISPLPHIRREPLGMVLVPLIGLLLSGFMFGWGSAPYDPHWARRFPRKNALMALAGPMANIAIALVAYLGMVVGVNLGVFDFSYVLSFTSVVTAESASFSGVAMVLSLAFMMNLFLALFNLLPLPPLDGSSVIGLVLPERYLGMLEEVRTNPTFQMAGLIIIYTVGAELVLPVFRWVVSQLL